MKRLISIVLTGVLVVQTLAFSAFAATTSGVESFVTRCYEIALGREPDSEGLKGWTEKLVSGEACGVSVAYGFVNSPEFKNAGYSNSDYVEKMYNMLLGRGSDTQGKASWVSKLDAGEDREDIFAGFANSQEFYNLCNSYGVISGYYIVGSGMERNANINSFVDRLYTICLGRHGDQGGQSGWVSQLANGSIDGATAAYGFVFSPEFVGKKLDNYDYVDTLYAVFLGRTPDAPGIEAWTRNLDNKLYSREGVFNGFANSPEFSGICDNYGILRGNSSYAANTFTPVINSTGETYYLFEQASDAAYYDGAYREYDENQMVEFYSSEFYDMFSDARWWSYTDNTLKYYNVYNGSNLKTMAFSLKLKNDSSRKISFDYYYYDSQSSTYILKYSDTITPKKYGNGTFYDIDYPSTSFSNGMYLLVVTDGTARTDILMAALCLVE